LKAEQLVDLQSQKIFLSAINSTLKQRNSALQIENNVLQKLATREKTSPKKTILMISLILIPTISLVPNFADFVQTENENLTHNTKYFIQNLRGDTVDTWLHWNLMENEQLVVNIVNSGAASQDKISAVKATILSEETTQIDDSLLHKGPQGHASTYYMGWAGALKQASKSQTEFYIPSEFVVLESAKGEGHITINLVLHKDADGYTGYTKSITENNQILKSTITIYDVNSLSAEQIATIVRHEFGHALGLAHSSAPEDLMAPQITTQYPYISECNVDAIIALYDGQESSQVVCEK